jgi:hypothetical protein
LDRKTLIAVLQSGKDKPVQSTLPASEIELKSFQHPAQVHQSEQSCPPAPPPPASSSVSVITAPERPKSRRNPDPAATGTAAEKIAAAPAPAWSSVAEEIRQKSVAGVLLQRVNELFPDPDPGLEDTAADPAGDEKNEDWE